MLRRLSSLLALVLLVPACLIPVQGQPTAPTSEPVPPPGAPTAPDADPAPSGPAGLTRWNWTLIDCTFVYGLVPADASKVKALLPPGFLVGGLPLVGFETDVCASGAGANGTVAPMTYASFWVAVTPPAHLRVPGAVAHFVNFDTLIPDADRRGPMVEAGIAARNGTIAESYGPGRSTVDLQLEGFGALHFEIAGGGAPSGGGAASNFAQYTKAANGTLARWKTDYRPTQSAQGAGAITLPPGTWLRELFGADVVPARFTWGHWSYTNGFVEFPIQP